MEFNRKYAQQLRNEKKYTESVPIYKELWENSSNRDYDYWLGWEYADSLKKSEMVDESIGICKRVRIKNKNFKYINDLLSWCLYEKYIKNIDNKISDNKDKTLEIANYITKLVKQQKGTPYELTVWKIISLFKDSFNASELNVWLDKLEVSLLSDVPSITNREGKVIELASNMEKWYYLKCKVLKELSQYKNCIELCETATSIINKFHNNRDIWLENYKAYCVAMLGDKDKAVDMIKSILIKNEHWCLYHSIFNIETELKNYDDGLVYAYTAALSKDPIKGKVNLYYEMGHVLEIKEEYKFAKMHYLLCKKIREEKGWKVSNDLKNCIERLSYIEVQETDVNNLHQELKKYWMQQKISNSKRFSGKIMTIFPNRKSGFVKCDSGSYFFKVSSILGDKRNINEGDSVKFSLVDSYDKKKSIETKEAVDIVVVES